MGLACVWLKMYCEQDHLASGYKCMIYMYTYDVHMSSVHVTKVLVLAGHMGLDEVPSKRKTM